MTFVLIYGPPAAGKLTVARELARLTGFKLFHNHLSIDLVKAVFDRGTPSFGRVGEAIRELVFEEAARENVNLIFTYAYAHGVDDTEIARIVEATETCGGKTQLVQLTCTPDALRRRVTEASRHTYGKIKDVATMEHLLETYDLFTPYPAKPSLQLDATHTPPLETAAAIAAHLKTL